MADILWRPFSHREKDRMRGFDFNIVHLPLTRIASDPTSPTGRGSAAVLSFPRLINS